MMYAVNNLDVLSGIINLVAPATNINFTTDPTMDGLLDQDFVDHLILHTFGFDFGFYLWLF